MSENTPSAQKPAKADDRNLVAVDAEAGASLEDRVFLFWKDYRSTVIAIVALALLAILGREAWQAWSRSQEEGTAAAFAAAESVEAKAAFAKAHAGHPLAALAQLAVADASYAKADYAVAATQYAEAVAALTDPELAARAKLGGAMSNVQAGQTEKGVSALLALANDTSVMSAIRAEAWYQAATVAVDTGDFAAARSRLDSLASLDASQMWIMRAESLRRRMPAEELAPTEGASAAPTP